MSFHFHACLYDKLSNQVTDWSVDRQYEHTLSKLLTFFGQYNHYFTIKVSLQSKTSEGICIFSTFIALNSSNSILQLERAVRALYFIGTSVRSRITRSGRVGARGACRGAREARLARARPWERSAFNVSHVLETLLPRPREQTRRTARRPRMRQGRRNNLHSNESKKIIRQ